MDTTADQAAMHSSSHREDEVSEGARRKSHQTTLKFNAAASDDHGQMCSEKSLNQRIPILLAMEHRQS